MSANTTDATDDESSDTTDRCCESPSISKVPRVVRERSDSFEGVYAICKTCDTQFGWDRLEDAQAIARETRTTCDGCGEECSPVQVVDVLDQLEVYCQDCSEDCPGVTADDEWDDTTKSCCDDPHVVALPERRFKLPGRRHRETYGECMNCGTQFD
ncbi:hypothetical protein ACODNH_21275 (plasmid) [Haloarcula sp. NS06]|uniref:hypothetical protein n=1 Tax=Haloarcula sp. NS06 TaxID=3409688 RepID=UPI003DA71EE6